MIRKFARSYAQALIKTAGTLEEAQRHRAQVRSLREAMDAVPAIARMAANPAVPMDHKREIVRQITSHLEMDDLTVRFALLLLDNYRLHHLPAVLDALEMELNGRLGVSIARVTTAQPIDDEQAERLRRVLATLLDQDVELELSADPDLIAGFRARVGSTLYDASLRGQLDRLTQQLAEA